MRRFYAAVFSDLERHSAAWTSLPKERAIALIDRYRSLAEALAGRFGASHQNFSGDGHLFLFQSSDVAVQFALALSASWDQVNSGGEKLRLPLRLGCHFGECASLHDGASWIGRAIGLAKRIESAASGGALLVTETVLEMLDLPLYAFEPAGCFALKGDYLADRALYRIRSVDEKLLKSRAPEEVSAEEAFLRALASAGHTQEHHQEEARWYREAIKRRPDYAEAHNNFAIVLRHLKNEQEAVAHYHEALRIRPNYLEAHYNYALLLAARGSLASAAEHLNCAIQERPDYVEAHHALANIVKLRGDLQAARRCYERTLELRPGYAEAHNNFAIFLHEVGELVTARNHYREAIRLRSDYAEAHYNFALLLEDAGQVVAAQKHYEQALGLWPDYAEAHNNLAALLHTQGCLEEAEPHYVRALELRPSDPETHYNFALLLRAKGDETRASQYFAIARELTPDGRTGTVIEPPR
jgi:tetratricopeptide (TPR) repeat protein